MATVTKTARTLQAPTTIPDGGTTVDSGLPQASAFSGLATLVVTNGASAPSIGCNAILEISPDGARWCEFTLQAAGLTPATSYVFHVEVPPGVINLRSRFAGNNGQAVTVEASFQELTAIG